MVNETHITPRKFSRSTLFFILNYLACLIIGIIIISVILGLTWTVLYFPLIFSLLILTPLIFLISLITYLSLRYFDLTKKGILISTIFLSIIISAFSFGIYFLSQYIISSVLLPLQSSIPPEMATFGSIGGITSIFRFRLTNPITLSILTIILYNLFPFINLLKKKKPIYKPKYPPR
jgi:hypothetical protein